MRATACEGGEQVSPVTDIITSSALRTYISARLFVCCFPGSRSATFLLAPTSRISSLSPPP